MASFTRQNDRGFPRSDPLLGKLPAELVIAIMVQLPDVQCLTNFYKASPRALSIFKENRGYLLKQLLRGRLGCLLPIAVARLEASKAEWTPEIPLRVTKLCDGYDGKCIALCHHYLADQVRELRVPNRYFTLERARELLSFHDRVSDWVNTFSAGVLVKPSRYKFHSRHQPPADDLEWYPVAKTLYTTELASILIPVRYDPVPRG
ncbi:hypothetical protein F5Y05DRAFT_65623 [Hypoxylon sp. FL0543]|nr:hypothetical protein F5Y05DRAFT_65623 [Hypoxylon sp. FL0543]